MNNPFSPVTGYLALEDGKIFTGYHFGFNGLSTGEIVFNTSMTGYQEILSDPSYAEQIITMTYPEIGNYGCNDLDQESHSVYAKGLVIKNLSHSFSNHLGLYSLADYLLANKVIGLYNIDTRALTRHIRDLGAMRAVICDASYNKENLVDLARNSKSMLGLDLTSLVTRNKPSKIQSGRYKIACLDYGIKDSIINCLKQFDFDITVFPANTRFAELMQINPDGFLLSNGPGDPSSNEAIINEVIKIKNSHKPILAICLGHQLMALACKAKTYKLKFGHRGGNQPVKNLLTNQVHITAHNHGFAVDIDSLPDCLVPSFINLNDNSLEGFFHKELPINCVQFHPEAHPGPTDAMYLFENFYNVVKLNYQ